LRDSRSLLQNRWVLIVSGLLGLAVLGIVVERVTRPKENPTADAEIAPRQPNVDLLAPVIPPPPATPSTDELVSEGSKLADELAAAAPSDSAALASSGRLFYLLGDSDKAMEQWENALQCDPQSAQALAGMAEYYHERGDFERAVEFMRRMATADPVAARDKTFLLADSLLNLGEPQELIDALDQAAKTGPLPPWAVIMRGQAFYQLEDYEKSVQQYEAALKKNPESSTAHYGISLALARLDRDDEAREHRQEYARLKKNDMEVYDRVRGHGTQKERHTTDTLRSIIAKFHFETGVLMAAKGRRDDAEQHLYRSWALAPEQPQPRQMLERLRRN
jgi:tetratricopeptide (TPR) repeat protein